MCVFKVSFLFACSIFLCTPNNKSLPKTTMRMEDGDFWICPGLMLNLGVGGCISTQSQFVKYFVDAKI